MSLRGRIKSIAYSTYYENPDLLADAILAAVDQRIKNLETTLKEIHAAAKPYDGESVTTSFIVAKAEAALKESRASSYQS